jgi:hypothetical protein
MSRLKILIRMHPFTWASYNPFESLHIDHIGPLPGNDRCIFEVGRMIIHQDYGRVQGCRVQLPAFGRFGTPDVIYTDQDPTISVLERGERSR